MWDSHLTFVMPYQPGTTSRIQCDIGGFSNCVVVNVDGTLGGAPDELTLRRYQRFGAGGAKLIWGGEAAAVQPDGGAGCLERRQSAGAHRRLRHFGADLR